VKAKVKVKEEARLSMSLEAFLEAWFGLTGGRELGNPKRFFTDKPSDLWLHVRRCSKLRLPCYASVQPFKARDQPYGIEKLYFDFDAEKAPQKALEEAIGFAKSLREYYGIEPFLKLSGHKGCHVDVFLTKVVAFEPSSLQFAKEVYEALQLKLLRGLSFETLDSQVIGDIKRLERVPYSIHEASGSLCQPIDADGKPMDAKDLDLGFYRRHGLDEGFLGLVCQELKENARLRERDALAPAPTSVRNPLTGTGEGEAKAWMRPCIMEALKKPLEGPGGHLMRLAIAVEHLVGGYSVEEVVALFKSQPDFNEAKSRYYVENALKKGYRPFRCRTIERLGFCLPGCERLRKRGKEE
jgi:hypothetical protein